MERYEKPVAGTELVTLRDGIRLRYQAYHNRDSLRFPLFEFNTNRVNYEPLRESFEDELFIVRGIDRQHKTIHIPSTTTLSQLFTDDDYVPNPKIWHTCRLYAAGSLTLPIPLPAVPSEPKRRPFLVAYRWPLLSLAGFAAGLLVGSGFIQRLNSPIPDPSTSQRVSTGHGKVRVLQPLSKSHVPSTFVISGLAAPGDVVWIVTFFEGTDYYWIQFPALADHRGHWFQAVHISGAGLDKAGRKHQLRVFINPITDLKTGDVLYAWPKATYSSAPIDIIMDPAAPVL